MADAKQGRQAGGRRIAVGGFLHESHSFAPRPTRYEDFLHPGGFPPLTAGPALLDVVRGISVALGGAVTLAEAEGVALVPLAWGFANPAGPVQDEAFERIAAVLCAGLSAALESGPLDGVYLDLHGAAMADSFPDAEGELLRRVRAVVGAVPVAISLDPHANLTRRMVEAADVIVPYRTYPHVDMRDAGSRAMRLLLDRIGRGRPWARAFRQVPFWVPLPSQCTLSGPMADVLAERARLAGPGVVELAFCFGFPYADFADCGVAVAAYADTQAAADEAAGALAGFMEAREASFALSVMEAGPAVAEAVALARTASRPVVIADTQDNPGGGGHGDTTGLLTELIAQHASGAVLAPLNDADSAAACHAAGEGAQVALSLGGRSDGVPWVGEALVLRLTDGRYVNTGPMGRGTPVDLGPCALVGIGDGVRVIVVSRKTQAYDQALFRHMGIEPADCAILALKSSVHFRADFEPIAASVIVAASPGPVVADPAILPFRNIRPGVRLRPMANTGASA